MLLEIFDVFASLGALMETQAGPLLQQVVWKFSSNRRRKCKRRSKKDLIARPLPNPLWLDLTQPTSAKSIDSDRAVYLPSTPDTFDDCSIHAIYGNPRDRQRILRLPHWLLNLTATPLDARRLRSILD